MHVLETGNSYQRKYKNQVLHTNVWYVRPNYGTHFPYFPFYCTFFSFLEILLEISHYWLYWFAILVYNKFYKSLNVASKPNWGTIEAVGLYFESLLKCFKIFNILQSLVIAQYLMVNLHVLCQFFQQTCF